MLFSSLIVYTHEIKIDYNILLFALENKWMSLDKIYYYWKCIPGHIMLIWKMIEEPGSDLFAT